MKRLVLTLVLCLPVFAAPAIIRNAPAIAFDDDVHIVRTGDFNGDSHLDFAVRGLDGVHIVLGNGDGTFDAPIEIAIADGPTLEFADLDADNDLDFVLTVGNTATSTLIPTHVYLNNGAAVFTAGTTIYSKSEVLRLADVTGDSKPDLITCGAYYPGLGDGTFGPIHQHENCSIDSTYVFDADADGDLDILTANFTTLIGATWPSELWRNDGAGTFVSVEVPVKSRAVAIADFDDNDLPDIAWLDKTGHRVVLFANAGGTYTEQTSDSGYAKVRDLTATDLNGDSRPDLIAAGDGLAHVWLTEPGGAMSAHTIFATGNETSAIATGDFDADGNIDMLAVGRTGTITGTTTQSLVSLLLGAGGGAFDVALSHQLSRMAGESEPNRGELTHASIRSVALSDVDGDGNLDMAIATADGQVGTYMNAGDGSFDAPVVTPVPTNPTSSERSLFADFNGDGRKDLAYLKSTGWTEIWLAQSSGTFIQSTTFITGLGEITAGDFDGDGKRDLVLFSSSSNTSTFLFHGNGNGTFASTVLTRQTPALVPPTPLTTADFNNDGRLDFTTGTYVFLGQANGTFVPLPTNAPGAPTLATDLNADGKADLVYALKDAPQGTILTYLGHGDGTFSFRRRMSIYSQSSIGPASAAADIDGDGNMDVVLGATVLFGDGIGGFDGYARFRTLGKIDALALGDVDKNGSLDLISATTNAAHVILTKTTDALELPLTLTVEELDAPVNVGSMRTVEAEVLGETFAAEGAVMFALNGTIGAFAEPSEGDAASSIMIVPGGNVSLTATYSGDVIYATTTSPATPPMTVTKATVTANASFSPSSPTWQDAVHVIGQLQGFTYIQPTGTIAVILDGNPHSTIAAPTFDINFGSLSIGTHSVVLQYSGDANFNAHETFVSFTVGKPTAPFQFTAVPVEHTVGTITTFKAFFPNHPSITGVVRFYRDSTVLGEATISNARASLDVLITPPVGPVQFDATFLGNDLYAQTEVDALNRGVGDTFFAPGPTSLYLLTPCRVIDTRDPDGDHGGPTVSTIRRFLMAGRCGIPFGAKALTVNITAVNPPAAGYFIFFAAPTLDVGYIGASTISYRASKTRANNAIVRLSAGGYMGIYNGHYELPVHVLVDVTGYFK